MNSNELLDIIGLTPERYVLDAANIQTVPPKKLPPKKTWLIAAIVALISLLVGCAVVYVLSLDQMILGTQYIEDRPGVTEPRTRLSLQGYVGSNSYMGAKEWFEFEQTYDPDGKIMQSLSNEEMIMPEEYWSYNCYTPEMTAKVDEICQKYGLETLGKAIFPLREEDFYTTLQIDRLVKENAAAESELSPEYFYRTGTFMLSCETKLTGEKSPWIYPIEYQYRCVMKTDFDTVFLSVGDAESYDQWEYTTSDGTELLLAISEDQALLIADLNNAFITMNIRNPRVGDILAGEQMMTREAMEAFAETFDFSFTPQRPTAEQIAQLDAQYDALLAEIKANQEAEQEKFQEHLGRASYDARVKFHLESTSETNRLGYTFYDFDGNGVEELVIGRDGYIQHIYTEKDGETAAILDWFQTSPTYLATDGTLVNMSGSLYRFFHVENGERVSDYWIERRAYWEDSPWRLCYSIDDDRPITEEEYDRYRTEKERVVLEMLPLTDYPLPEPASYNTDGKDIILYSESYEDLIRTCILNPVELEPGVFSESSYVLRDLDNDGQEELIISNEFSRSVYTTKDGKIAPMYSNVTLNGAGLNICKGNIIEIIHAYSGENKVYCYYRMSGTKSEMVEYLRYDADRNPQNPWFRSTDASGQDTSLEPITKAEFDSIRKQYAPIDLPWKNVTDYPLSVG